MSWDRGQEASQAVSTHIAPAKILNLTVSYSLEFQSLTADVCELLQNFIKVSLQDIFSLLAGWIFLARTDEAIMPQSR